MNIEKINTHVWWVILLFCKISVDIECQVWLGNKILILSEPETEIASYQNQLHLRQSQIRIYN